MELDVSAPSKPGLTCMLNNCCDSLQGTNHASYEIKLATPLLLVSKVCLFNWMGSPNMVTMLDQFNVLQNAAMEIQRK
jgi:hypothetical protein